MVEISGGRVRGRPKLDWMDRVKVALSSKGITVEPTRQCAKDRFLSNRSQQVMVEGCRSRLVNVVSGVP